MASRGPSGPSYCAVEVRREDHDRYLTALFAPAGRREDLFALYAFNLEVAKTAEVVSEPMIGQIRLQWWRDSIAEIFDGSVRHHPVVEALAGAVRAGGLDRALLDRLIDSRERDLEAEPVESLDDLVRYVEESSATLVELALGVLRSQGDAALAAGRAVGIAWALSGLLRAVPFHASQGRCYLPRDMRAGAGLDRIDAMGQAPRPGLTAVVEKIAGVARDHLHRARAVRAEVPREAFPALAPARLADGYLKRLLRAGYDPFDTRVQAPRPSRALVLALAAAAGRY
jgi:NADH dehydrogenase [ubiquinone] 1 alpha subcomplex assembly factor 6